MVGRFEAAWEEWNELPGRGGLAAGRAVRWRRSSSPGSQGETVLCPSNTFMATPLAAIRRRRATSSSSTATATTCACRSPTSRPRPSAHRPRAAILVHIGGHIAFEVERDRRLLPGAWDLPDRGLRPRPRRVVERAQAGTLGRRRRLLAVRDQDDLDRRGRRARLPPSRGARVRARVSQLRQARLRGAGSELPHERVHRRAGAGADRAPAGDRGVEERGRPRAAGSARIRAASSCPTAWSPASTSTSCSTGSSARPGASTTSPATGSWATTSSCRTPTGWPRNHSCVPLYYRPERKDA